jgi:DNA-binding transcriptional ArsR family regulator
MTVAVIDDPEQVAAIAHPLRVAILDALRSPDSAAGAARIIGESRQKVGHHVKVLLDTGLIVPAGERRKGGFVEQLLQSVATSFVVSSRLANSGDQRVEALRAQVPLERLVALGERVQRDAVELLDRAAFDGEQIPSLAVEAEVRFPDAASRAAFMEEYLEVLKPLLKKHGSRKGDGFRVAAAVYPERNE